MANFAHNLHMVIFEFLCTVSDDVPRPSSISTHLSTLPGFTVMKSECHSVQTSVVKWYCKRGKRRSHTTCSEILRSSKWHSCRNWKEFDQIPPKSILFVIFGKSAEWKEQEFSGIEPSVWPPRPSGTPMISPAPTWISFESALKRPWIIVLLFCLLCKCPVFLFCFCFFKCSTSNQNPAGIISCPIEEIEATDMKTRKLPTIPGRFHTKKEDVD